MPEDICVSCTEVVDPNYTVRTGDLFICGPDDVTRDIGNVSVLDFTFRPNVIEHFKGKDGSLDAIIPLNEDFMMVVTVDRLTPYNASLLLAQSMVETAEGCEVPFARPDCDRKYRVQFVHTFPCSGLQLIIDFWSAIIIAEGTMQFGESLLNFPLNIRATRCDSLYPTKPYGRMLFSASDPCFS